MSILSLSPLVSPLLAPLTSLSSITPRHIALLSKISAGQRIIDLLFTLPEKIIDRRHIISVADGQKRERGDILTFHLRVISIRRPNHPSQPTTLVTEDDTGSLEIAFFQKKNLFLPPPGTEIIVSGKISFFQKRISLSRPDHIYLWEKRHSFPWLEPIWPLTAGLFTSTVKRAIEEALSLIPDLPEWQNSNLIDQHVWPSFRNALIWVHRPTVLSKEKNPYPFIERARARLSADEILANQLCLGLARRQAEQRPGRAFYGDGKLRAQLRKHFGFTPTDAQERAIAEIAADMEKNTPMVRLLQGDVGSGKTFVAIMAMLHAVESGAQAALMAPTEILAQQHIETVSRLTSVPCVFLSGSVKGKARRSVLTQITEGYAKIIIGTHALFQDGVIFANLGLAVIDEQHRFGVEQRVKLSRKGNYTDLLVMTATPIPRTVQLMEWGEMGVSRLDTKPAGRQAIHTTVHSMAMINDIFAGIKRALENNKQVFWVCPLIENSETRSAAAAEDRWEILTQNFGSIVGIAHGRQDIATRHNALETFKEGKTRLLVATTVIEVGVDIPNATIMVIEQAERFGLAQLHQLRGRVGRGSERSFCLLLHSDETSPNGQRRLSLLRESEDGFFIADEDFRIRGGGDLAGSRQSGLPGFRLSNDVHLSLYANRMSENTQIELNRNPNLQGKQGIALQALLHLFDRASPERMLVSG